MASDAMPRSASRRPIESDIRSLLELRPCSSSAPATVAGRSGRRSMAGTASPGVSISRRSARGIVSRAAITKMALQLARRMPSRRSSDHHEEEMARQQRKMEGDENQRRAAAREAHAQGKRPSELRATLGASKQRKEA